MKHDAPVSETFAAEELLARMKAAGVDVLLANGGTDFPSIIEAFARASETGLSLPEPLVIPHENVAVGMAHGYYLVARRPAGVIVHVNVGLANSVMGLLNARSDQIPILMCSGRTPITEEGRFGSRSGPIHWGQEMFDQGGMVREAVKWDYELRFPEQAGPVIDRAMSVALSEPRGPVYLSLPREALADTPPSGTERHSAAAIKPTRYGAPPAEAVAEAAELLASAKDPLVLSQSPELGSSFEPFASFVERHALPVVEPWATRQALPTNHPMHLGREPHALVRQADVILVVNAKVPWIKEQVPLAEGCKVIAIGPDPQHGTVPMRTFPCDVCLAGGTVDAIAALDAAMAERSVSSEAVAERRERVAGIKAAQAEDVAKRVEAGSGSPMNAAFVTRCVSQVIDENFSIFNELGLDPSVLELPAPNMFFSTPLSGGLGWGLPAALGGKLADRDRQVIACVGDGSYMFANPVACHQTAAAQNLPVLTIVFNNGVWNAVRRATLSMYPDGNAAAANVMPITGLEPAPDYAAVARAHGAHAERVESGDELPAALDRALAATRASQQALLEVVVSY